jgi:serine/threonine-protein kinase HipA
MADRSRPVQPRTARPRTTQPRTPRTTAYKPVNAIEVRLWDQRVGAVALEPSLGVYAFEYEPSFIRSGLELAPLQMPLSRSRTPFIFPDLPELTFKRLPAILADALPDDFGNNLINSWMAQRGIPKDRITALDRLAYMGKRGMGALEFRPVRGPNRESATAIQLSSLVESARLAVHGELDSDAHSEAALAQIIRVGTSAGGARAKATVAWNPSTNELRAGQFEVEPGFEHWLLKFDGIGPDFELGSSQQYGRIEYAYFLMARAAGITISDCRLLEENGRAHFMTRRFDRTATDQTATDQTSDAGVNHGVRKHHLQTLCAISHLDYKQRATHDYSQYFQTISELNLGRPALEEAFRRMAFNVMARNHDDHTKNFSFMLEQPQTGQVAQWKLAPAYDVTFAFNPQGEWTNQHLMGVGGKFAKITRADLLEVAERFGLGNAPRLLEQVKDAIRLWPEFAARAGVDAVESKRIEPELQTL